MIIISCLLFFSILSGLGVGCAFAPLICIPITAAYLVFLIVYFWQSYCDAEVHPIDKLAHILYRTRSGLTPNLPDSLKGVWWMDGNPAPETLIMLDGLQWNEAKRELTMLIGAPLTWSFNTGCVGWMFWALVRFGRLFCPRIRVRFNPEIKNARMPFFLFNCIWIPFGQVWYCNFIEDGAWDRDIRFYCSMNQRWEFGAYTLRRIIDQDGNETPAFADLMKSINSGELVKNFTRKTKLQIVNGKFGGSGPFGLCPGPDSYAEAYLPIAKN